MIHNEYLIKIKMKPKIPEKKKLLICRLYQIKF